MTQKIRVGIAGAGFIGAVHAQAYKHIPDVEVVGIADPITEKAEPLAKETSSRVFRDYEELLRAGVDILNVALAPALHLPAALAAAQAGAHVLMEKPIARTLAEADEMIAACNKAGVNLMTGFTHHFYPEMIKARELVQSGVIGKPLIVHDAMSITYSFVLPWYRNKEIAGGGVFMCNAVHGFDRAAWAIGQSVQSVCAIVEPTTGTRAEDYGAALAKFDGGVQGNFFQHWGPYRSLQCELQVFGEDGMVHVRSWDSVELMIGDQRTITHFYKPDSGLPDRSMVGMINELTEMVNSVREKRPPSVTGQDGRNGLADVLAVYESAATGQWVSLQK
ncbi:MAG TPA: Gfo/Idh/MocA family oxidoreductase [Anaerolineae bacterium]|nr:Gfo/Idh/MocA family oxidoreductase [Anaerolineae bacterium]